MIGLLILLPTVCAFPFLPETELKIVSEILNPGDSEPVFRMWTLVPESAPDGTYLLKFFPEVPESLTPFCELKINLTSGEIEWHGTGRKRKKSGTNGMMIVPGFPAPCDILPVAQKEPVKTYKDSTQAGGRVFVKKYRILREDVSSEEAKKNGWLEKNIPEPAGFIMMTAVDEQEHLVVKQLWPVNGTWWIYEETPYRRSRIVQ